MMTKRSMEPDSQTPTASNAVRGRRSIATKLVVAFSLLFAVTMIAIQWMHLYGVPGLPDTGRIAQHRAEAFSSLALIADLKKERLLRWLEERADDLEVTAASVMAAGRASALCSAVREAAEPGAEGGGRRSLARTESRCRALEDYLHRVARVHEEYAVIFLADAQTGVIVVATEQTLLGDRVSRATYFREALKSSLVRVGNVDRSRRQDPYALPQPAPGRPARQAVRRLGRRGQCGRGPQADASHRRWPGSQRRSPSCQ